jgi:hypothetical protein
MEYLLVEMQHQGAPARTAHFEGVRPDQAGWNRLTARNVMSAKNASTTS